MTKQLAVRYWLPVLLYVLIIFILSSMSAPPIPRGISGDLLHYPEFAVLGLLLARALQSDRAGAASLSHLAWAFVVTVIFGASDEFHQAFVPDRVPDVMDWFHDAIGAAVGVTAWGTWRWARR